jgi:hypothetical protein
MRVFVLEDDPFRIKRFRDACLGRHDLTLTDRLSGPRGAFTVYQPPYDLIYLDHDLGGRQMVDSREEETGAAFTRWMPVAGEEQPQPVITIHSYNLPGATNMHRLLRDKGYTKVILWPFCQTVIDVLKEAVLSLDVDA